MAKFKSCIGKTVELTNERRKHVFERHPDVELHFDKIEKTLLEPNEIRIDKHDLGVLLFYKRFSKMNRYLVVVVKINKRNFILTFYSTKRIRTGDKYELKN